MESLKRRISPFFDELKKMKKSGRLERADQILLGLSHSGSLLFEQTLLKIENNPGDLIGRVCRSVLERAQMIRSQVASPLQHVPSIKRSVRSKKAGAKKPSPSQPTKKVKRVKSAPSAANKRK